MPSKKINVQGSEISILNVDNEDYISLSDIARFKDAQRVNYIVQNWIRNRNSLEFLGLWEKLNNPNFKGIEFDAFKAQAGLNSFSVTPQKWVQKVNAIGIISKSGRYGGGTFAHKDIAFEFATWISPEFKRLKKKKSLEWNVNRLLAKVNYKVHTDAVKENLIPPQISENQTKQIYANEADILNVAMFGITALEWRTNNPKKKGNIRDHANITQLICLTGLESLNAEFIRQYLPQGKRLKRLNEIAIIQMKSLTGQKNIKKLK
jgi:KilA-N domain